MLLKATPVRYLLTCLLFFLLSIAHSSGSAADAGNLPPTAADDELGREIVTARGDVTADPAKAAAHIRLGNLLFKKGDLPEALASFDAALKLNPRSHEAKTGKGSILVRRGEWEEAERLLREALLLNPDPVRTHYELGLLYEKREQFGRAVAEYREGLKKYGQGRK